LRNDCSTLVFASVLFEWGYNYYYYSKVNLNDILVIFPSTQEQQAIADCLSSLDKLISEENEQIGRLKDHKKGLMQQLFPKIQ